MMIDPLIRAVICSPVLESACPSGSQQVSSIIQPAGWFTAMKPTIKSGEPQPQWKPLGFPSFKWWSGARAVPQAMTSPFCQTSELKEEVMEIQTLLLIPDKRSSTTKHGTARLELPPTSVFVLVT